MKLKSLEVGRVVAATTVVLHHAGATVPANRQSPGSRHSGLGCSDSKSH